MCLVIQKNGKCLHTYMRTHHERNRLVIIELSVAQFEQGRLLIITNKSGHYKPGTVTRSLEITFCSLESIVFVFYEQLMPARPEGGINHASMAREKGRRSVEN